MRITVEHAALLRALTLAQSVAERRSAIPILTHVLIEAEGDAVSLWATDLDMEVCVRRLPARIEQPGAVTVPARALYDYVRRMPRGALVRLATDPATERLSIQAGRSQFALATLPREDFPVMASAEYACSFVAPADALRRLFDKSKFAIATGGTRHYLCGAYMHVASGEGGAKVLRCVATDGHRLARIDAPLPAGAAAMPGVIVPRKTVGELCKLLDDDAVEIAVSVSGTKVRFATPEITLTSKVLGGTFPDYARVIPTRNARRLEIGAAEFARALRNVTCGSAAKVRAVELRMEDDRLVLSCNDADGAAATEVLTASYAAEPLRIGFNASYLLDALAPFGKRVVAIDLRDAVSPALIHDPNDLSEVYVVVPMRA